MKKYQRLLLVIVSAFSLISFLIYRHEYNRLRQVLEVFNFFGTPCNVTELHKSDAMLLEYDWGPQPIWQEVDNNSFLFSAFLSDQNIVQGIGVRAVNIIPLKSCFVHFEDKPRPLKGKLSMTVLHESGGFTVYTYKCSYIGNSLPYAVSIASSNKYANVLISNALKGKGSFKTTLCIYPHELTKKSLYEFLSFHSLLGVESFIVYHGQSIPYRTIKLLRNFTNTLEIWISFFSLYLPLSIPRDFVKIVLEYDCRLRTQSHSNYSTIIGVNDYVVPSTVSVKADLRLAIKKFCLKNISKAKPIVLENFESIEDYNYNEIVNVNSNNITGIKTTFPSLFTSNCVVYRYEKCFKHVKTKVDFSMKRFSTDLTRTTLVQLLIQNSD
ncbi:hypothetical protein ABEB36_013200 [Hypothenemus hampei]|uniref:Glycosyltransferase family 92 protein n=1 Tax=Hypothenemus hampei TaxID=57062 RepID=A0ABD1E769_HYPHA